ncbi:MAG: DUF2142 domain-containing protein [Burkholderiaceae bacterium]
MRSRFAHALNRLTQPWREMPWVLLVIVFLAAQSMVSAMNTPLGYAPDEIPHLSYVRDGMASPSLMPDYAGGKTIGFRQPNYLAHPPLYYSSLAAVGKVFHLDPKGHYLVFRSLSVAYVTLGLMVMALVARQLGLGPGTTALTLLACAAVPMFPYLAGSVTNDTLLYLGVTLAIYGLVLSLKARDGVPAAYRWPLLLGLLITFLTKATGMAFLVFFFLIYAVFSVRQLRLGALIRQVWLPSAAFALLVGGYYVGTYLTHGSLFPRAGSLYNVAPPENLLNFQGYATEFFSSMWRRLPGIVSHLSVAPLPEALAPVFYAMLMLPLVGWVIVRWSAPLLEPRPRVIQLFDALGLAAVATIAIHLVLGYRTYLGNGVLSGFQPRYYAYFLPLMWLPFFALCRDGWFRQSVTVLFALATVVSFWGSVPFVQLRQQEAMQSIEQGFVYQPPSPGARVEATQLVLRDQVVGHLDELSWNGTVLRGRGWVFDTEKSDTVQRLWILSGGRFLTTVKVQAARPDVAIATGNPKAEFAGFAFALRGLPSENTTLCGFRLLVEFRDGTFGRLPVTDCPVDN